MDKQETIPSGAPGQGAGRVSSVEEGQEEIRCDISCIDRQEGEMNNGELGGNFNEASEGKNIPAEGAGIP